MIEETKPLSKSAMESNLSYYKYLSEHYLALYEENRTKFLNLSLELEETYGNQSETE